MRLQDKVIVVTGGSQGIGEALARRYAKEGAAVAILNRSRDAGAAVAASIEEQGGRAVRGPVRRLGGRRARRCRFGGP